MPHRPLEVLGIVPVEPDRSWLLLVSRRLTATGLGLLLFVLAASVLGLRPGAAAAAAMGLLRPPKRVVRGGWRSRLSGANAH